MRTAAAVAVVLVGLAGPLAAHPVPNDNHDRTIVVRLTADAVEVDYRLEVDEARAAQDLPKADLAGVGSRRELREAVVRFHRQALAENLDARLDGKPLDFTAEGGSCEATDHLRCDFRFRAAWHPEPGARHTFAFREGNYELDDFSALRLSLAASGRVTLLSASAPDEALMAKPGSARKPGEGERLRKVSATFLVAIAESHVAPAEEVAQEKSLPEEAMPAAEAPPRNLLHLLLDSRQGFAALLLLAAGFGAAHALTPGHGKTLAAAYLVGERGTVGHALALGLVTTLTHTAAVLVLAALLPLLFRDTAKASVQTALELVGGLLIAGLGLWLLMVRLAGRADHVHLGGGHHHHHGGHTHDVPAVRPGWRGLVLMGVSGGLVPCWDALAMLALAVSTQKLWLALPLLLAFSAGLAGVLVAVGVAVVQARKWAGARWGNLQRFRGLERGLPLASAAVVTAMGLWLCFESVRDAGHDGPPPSAAAPAEPGR